jgi:hypothetical protein
VARPNPEVAPVMKTILLFMLFLVRLAMLVEASRWYRLSMVGRQPENFEQFSDLYDNQGGGKRHERCKDNPLIA